LKGQLFMKKIAYTTKLTVLLLAVLAINISTVSTASACWKRHCQSEAPDMRITNNHYSYDYKTSYDMAQYHESLHTEEGYQQAFEAYLDAAQMGDSRAAYRLAQLYEQGLYGTPRNMERAIYWYQHSNDSRAKFRLAQLAEMGKGMDYSPQQAIAYYTQAAELGDGRAIYRLSQNYKAVPDEPTQKGMTEPNKDQATYWLEESAKAGDGRSQYKLARAYHTGQYPVKRDLNQARYWYTKSALQGDTRSEFYLGQLYEFGGAGLASKPKAYAWYRIAKEQGHGWAVTPLARVSNQLKTNDMWSQGLVEYQAAHELRYGVHHTQK
jgi:TPR repeat protein